MRRRRKTKYTWLPADGQSITAGGTTVNIVPFTVSNVISSGAASALPSLVQTNCIADFPNTDLDTATTSLADAVGSEYFLKRIVGKVFVEVNCQTSEAAGLTNISRSSFPTVLVTIGFFIAPADPNDVSQPFGSATQQFDRYNPAVVDAIREPWIWRRSWLLSPIGTNYPAGSALPDEITGFTPGLNQDVGFGAFPNTNANYGSVADGPHIDAKTARRVRQHERLWTSMNMVLMPEGTLLSTNFNQVNAVASYDIRTLGALRKARNRSSFE